MERRADALSNWKMTKGTCPADTCVRVSWRATLVCGAGCIAKWSAGGNDERRGLTVSGASGMKEIRNP
jgi:hypothetical protein